MAYPLDEWEAYLRRSTETLRLYGDELNAALVRSPWRNSLPEDHHERNGDFRVRFLFGGYDEDKPLECHNSTLVVMCHGPAMVGISQWATHVHTKYLGVVIHHNSVNAAIAGTFVYPHAMANFGQEQPLHTAYVRRLDNPAYGVKDGLHAAADEILNFQGNYFATYLRGQTRAFALYDFCRIYHLLPVNLEELRCTECPVAKEPLQYAGLSTPQ
jgi:hypothetical protein